MVAGSVGPKLTLLVVGGRGPEWVVSAVGTAGQPWEGVWGQGRGPGAESGEPHVGNSMEIGREGRAPSYPQRPSEPAGTRWVGRPGTNAGPKGTIPTPVSLLASLLGD